MSRTGACQNAGKRCPVDIFSDASASGPTTCSKIKNHSICYDFFDLNLNSGNRKGGCQVLSRTGACQNAGKRCPVDIFSDASASGPTTCSKIKNHSICYDFFDLNLNSGNRKGGCQVLSRTGACQNAGKRCPVDIFSDASASGPTTCSKIKNRKTSVLRFFIVNAIINFK